MFRPTKCSARSAPRGCFARTAPIGPIRPYSATKASADHLARAWRETYGLPTILTNCSNNYGPYHFPEKLIPLAILNAVEGKRLPVYGRGENVRDWLYVEDHAAALLLVARRGVVGQSYNVGGRSERRNIDVVQAICDILDAIRPRAAGSYREQIEFVADRPGHDLRYAIDCREDRARARLAATRKLRNGPAQDGAAGTSTIPTGGARSVRANIAANVSA